MSGAKATRQRLYDAIVAVDVLRTKGNDQNYTSEMEKWKGKNGLYEKICTSIGALREE